MYAARFLYDFQTRCSVNHGPDLGGTVIVSGIGNFEEDEFVLKLLNEQVSKVHSFQYRNDVYCRKFGHR